MLFLLVSMHAELEADEEPEMITQPCIPSEFGGSFKEYLLEHDGKSVVSALKRGMDTRSSVLVDRILDIVVSFPDCGHVLSRTESVSQSVLDSYITEREILSYIEYVDLMDGYQERYGLSSPVVAQDVFFFHHGLKNAPRKLLSYIGNKTFVDAGAFSGDSAAVFLAHYSPRRVLSFDISPVNYNLYAQTMLLNSQVPHEAFQLYLIGLASEPETRWIPLKSPEFSDRQTARPASQHDIEAAVPVLFQPLDGFLDRFYPDDTIGFIKTDLEGAGLAALRGMRATIQRHRPVLSLAIYHNPEEFFETKPELERILEDVKYRYYLLRLYGGIDYFGEIVLFAYPAELGLYE